MALTPEQHAQIAAVYDKCAADHMVPPPQRTAFARKADWFRMLARLGAKPKSASTPPRPKKPPSLLPIHYAIPECSQRRGIYLRGSSVGRLATTPRAPFVFST